MTTAEQQAKFYRGLIKFDIDRIEDPDALHYLWLVVDSFYEEEKRERKASIDPAPVL